MSDETNTTDAGLQLTGDAAPSAAGDATAQTTTPPVATETDKKPAATARGGAKREPVVRLGNEVAAGMRAKHDNGDIFEVIEVLSEGVRLKGVSNLVHPSVLKPV